MVAPRFWVRESPRSARPGKPSASGWPSTVSRTWWTSPNCWSASSPPTRSCTPAAAIGSPCPWASARCAARWRTSGGTFPGRRTGGPRTRRAPTSTPTARTAAVSSWSTRSPTAGAAASSRRARRSGSSCNSTQWPARSTREKRTCTTRRRPGRDRRRRPVAPSGTTSARTTTSAPTTTARKTLACHRSVGTSTGESLPARVPRRPRPVVASAATRPPRTGTRRASRRRTASRRPHR